MKDTAYIIFTSCPNSMQYRIKFQTALPLRSIWLRLLSWIFAHFFCSSLSFPLWLFFYLLLCRRSISKPGQSVPIFLAISPFFKTVSPFFKTISPFFKTISPQSNWLYYVNVRCFKVRRIFFFFLTLIGFFSLFYSLIADRPEFCCSSSVQLQHYVKLSWISFYEEWKKKRTEKKKKRQK